MNTYTRWAGLTALAGCLAGLTACGALGRTAGHDAPELITVLRGSAHDSDSLLRTHWAGGVHLPGGSLPATGTITSHSEEMARPALGLPSDKQWAFISAGCHAVDMYDATTSPQELATWVISQDDGFAGHAADAYGLVRNLREADDAGDVTLILARANLCTIADAQTPWKG